MAPVVLTFHHRSIKDGTQKVQEEAYAGTFKETIEPVGIAIVDMLPSVNQVVGLEVLAIQVVGLVFMVVSLQADSSPVGTEELEMVASNYFHYRRVRMVLVEIQVVLRVADVAVVAKVDSLAGLSVEEDSVSGIDLVALLREIVDYGTVGVVVPVPRASSTIRLADVQNLKVHRITEKLDHTPDVSVDSRVVDRMVMYTTPEVLPLVNGSL